MNQGIRTIVFSLAALFVLAGAMSHFVHWTLAPYLFAVGAAGITVCYLTVPAKDLGARERRLHRFNVFAGLLMIVSSGFMFDGGTDWVAYLTISAIMQLYTAFTLPKNKS